MCHAIASIFIRFVSICCISAVGTMLSLSSTFAISIQAEGSSHTVASWTEQHRHADLDRTAVQEQASNYRF